MEMSEAYKLGHDWARHGIEEDNGDDLRAGFEHHFDGEDPDERYDFNQGYDDRIRANQQSYNDHMQKARTDGRLDATNQWDRHHSLHSSHHLRSPEFYARESGAPQQWKEDIAREFDSARDNYLDGIGRRVANENRDRGIGYDVFTGKFVTHHDGKHHTTFDEADAAARNQTFDPDKGRSITKGFTHEYEHPLFGKFKVKGYSDGTFGFDDGNGSSEHRKRSLPHANWVNENVVRSLQRHIDENDPPAIHFASVDSDEHPGRAKGYLQMLLHPQSPLVKAGYKGYVHSDTGRREDTFLAVKPEHVDKVPERFEPAAAEMADWWRKEKKVKLSKTPETIPVSVTPFSLTPDDAGHFSTGHIGPFRYTVHRPKDKDRFAIELKHKDGSVSHPSPTYRNVRTLLDAHKQRDAKSAKALSDMHDLYKPVRLSRPTASPMTLLINLNGKRVGTVIVPPSGPPSFFGGAQFLFSTIPSYLLDSGNGMYTVPGLGVVTIQRLA